MSKMIRILLVDDQKLVREGLQTLLEMQPRFQVIGEASNGHEAIDQYIELMPDVVLMDINMPQMDGVEATRHLCRTYADARVLILTTFDDDEYLFDGIRAGALGYLLKDVSSQDLANAVQVVAVGGSMMSPAVARKVLAQVSMPDAVDLLVEPLSDREKDVLALLGQGLSNAEISTRLHLASGTVKNYVSNILQKLDVRDRTQAVIKARKLRLVE